MAEENLYDEVRGDNARRCDATTAERHSHAHRSDALCLCLCASAAAVDDSVQFGNYIGPELGDSSDEDQQPGEYDEDEEGAEEAEWDETHGLDDEQQQQQAQQQMSDDTRMVTAAGRDTRRHTRAERAGRAPRSARMCAHAQCAVRSSASAVHTTRRRSRSVCVAA